jgi:hypothetical protein
VSRATSPSAPSTAASEPADYPDFDLSEPMDFSEPDAPPAPRVSSAAPLPTPANSEIDAILHELQRMKRGLVAMAIEDAQAREYRDGRLFVTFGSEDVFAKRLRESANLFREIGDRIFGRPISLEVKISGQIETQMDETELKRRQRHELAMRNPAIKLILEKTRGELLSVTEKQP